jgi:hypothetical protein
VSLTCKVFGKNTTRPKGGVEIFFKTRRALTLQDSGGTELPLPNEISGGERFGFKGFKENKEFEEIKEFEDMVEHC